MAFFSKLPLRMYNVILNCLFVTPKVPKRTAITYEGLHICVSLAEDKVYSAQGWQLNGLSDCEVSGQKPGETATTYSLLLSMFRIERPKQ